MARFNYWDSPYAGYLAISFAAIIWGTLGLVVRAIALPSYVIVFYRVVFSMFVVAVIVILQRNFETFKIRKHGIILILSGGILTLNWIAFFSALRLTTIANAVLLTYTYPILVAVMAPLFLKEKIEFATIISLILSIIGMILIVSPSELSFRGGDLFGIFYALISALTYAILVIAAKKMLPDISSYTIMFYQAMVVALVLGPLVFSRTFSISNFDWILLALLGAVHSTFAVYLYFKGLRNVKAQYASVFTYLDPVSATFFASLFLGEQPSVYTIVGGALILIAGFNVVRATTAFGSLPPNEDGDIYDRLEQ